MAADTASTSTRVRRRARTRGRSHRHRLSRFGRFVVRVGSRTWEVLGEAASLLVEVGPRAAGATGATRPAGSRKEADR